VQVQVANVLPHASGLRRRWQPRMSPSSFLQTGRWPAFCWSSLVDIAGRREYFGKTSSR